MFNFILAPIIASPPLFYLGNSQLSRRFNLNPQKNLHATFIDVEPVSKVYVCQRVSALRASLSSSWWSFYGKGLHVFHFTNPSISDESFL